MLKRILILATTLVMISMLINDLVTTLGMLICSGRRAVDTPGAMPDPTPPTEPYSLIQIAVPAIPMSCKPAGL